MFCKELLICDMLESGAFCVRKCEQKDVEKYHQYTTFYRIHCVDYEEDLEPHLPCLKKAAKDADADFLTSTIQQQTQLHIVTETANSTVSYGLAGHRT
ncbi:hypothetical protein ANCDUO_24454 [Ancylostoma duodenale]|uniref:Chondroitin proteoglycan 4 domain-containing protein n=1 Tax=Ancylostoma duodenale TaxID=51022 RepID=A0A0C2FAF2_9BILA|nr:hypothetical protein ANCDUO_24454 [Ancylostoma duodenale]